MTQDERAASADFTALYNATFAQLAAQLCAYLGDAAEAQDVAQEGYLRAWKRWDTICRYDDPAGWIRRVAWNLATSRWRRQALLDRFLHRRHREEAVKAVGPEHVALVAALRTIPERQRLVIVLHHLADRSVDDIATDLAVPRGTVLSWLHRGRARLAQELSDSTPSTSEGASTSA